jgi:hypothetical protein
MSRARVAWLALVIIVGCAPVPTWETAREYRLVSATPLDATYGCVVSVTDSLGYTVRASDRAGGFVRVERYYVPYIHWQARDLINVSIIPQSDARATLRLTAWTEETHRDLFGPTDISPRVLADATQLAARCGGGPLTVWSDTART